MLVKPSQDEFYDVAVPNNNMDKIDAALKVLSDALGGIDLSTLSQAIANVDNKVTTHLEEKATLTTFGHTRLSNDINSASEVMSATPKAVKQVNDKFKLSATTKLPTAVGWFTWEGEVELNYYKDSFGNVRIYGVVQKRSGGGTTIATMPVGYRPTYDVVCPYNGKTTVISPNGTLSAFGSEVNDVYVIDLTYRTT